MDSLKERTARAYLARVCSQTGSLIIRLVSLVVLARLLDPIDFGLVGMVAAFTELLNIFRDFGLSAAAIQRGSLSKEQASTLFWLNVALGAALSIIALALAPMIAAFYHEPRLVWITAIIATAFVLHGAGVQHAAILQRQMRFPILAAIEVLSLLIGASAAIAMAMAGYRYWALVAMTVAVPLTTTLGVWLAAAWIPGMPRRAAEIRPMLRFGGTLTLNSLLFHVTYNLEKVLLGRFWGPEAIGIYGRAYQLSRIPVDSLNSAIGEVAFAALSRLQNDPPRLKRYFIQCYSIVVALTLPLTIACALFADDLISILLGPKWKSAAEIFRILAPTVLVFAMGNPLGWLLNSLGRVDRLLKIALATAPLMITGYLIGLPYGPTGVALAYTGVMLLKAVPMSAWAVHGTVISVWDLLAAVSRPLASGAVAAGLAYATLAYGPTLSSLPRVIVGLTVFAVTYLGLLLFVAGQKSFYLELIRALKGTGLREAV